MTNLNKEFDVTVAVKQLQEDVIIMQQDIAEKLSTKNGQWAAGITIALFTFLMTFLLTLGVYRPIDTFRSELTSFRSELTSFRSELTSFKIEMRGEFKDFKAEMKEELSSFKTEIKDELKQIRADNQKTNARLDQLYLELISLRKDIK